MWRADSPRNRTPGDTKGLHGPRGRKHPGAPVSCTNTVRGGRKARGQFPQIRAAGRTHTPRGERWFTCEFPQVGDNATSPNGTPEPPCVGVGGPFR